MASQITRIACLSIQHLVAWFEVWTFEVGSVQRMERKGTCKVIMHYLLYDTLVSYPILGKLSELSPVTSLSYRAYSSMRKRY